MAQSVKRLVEIAIESKTDGAAKSLDDLTKRVTGLSAKQLALAAASAAAAVAVVKAFTEMAEAAYRVVEETAKIGDSFDKMSQRTSMSVETLSEWSYITQRAGGNIDQLERGLQGMVRSMRDVQEGSATAIRAWDDLGVSVVNADGSLRKVDDVLVDARQSISEMENDTEATALAMEVFGRAGRQLIPVLRLSNEEFEGQRELVKELGGVYGKDFTDGAAAFIDAQLNMKTATDGLKIAFGSTFTPALVEIINASAEGIATLGQNVAYYKDDIAEIANQVGVFFARMMNATQVAVDLVPVLVNINQIIVALGDKKNLKGAIDQFDDLLAASLKLKTTLDLIAMRSGGIQLPGDYNEPAPSGGGSRTAQPPPSGDDSETDAPGEITPFAGVSKEYGMVDWDWRKPVEDYASMLIDIPAQVSDAVANITDEQVKSWEEWQAAIEDMNDSVREMGTGLARVGAAGVTSMLGLRDGAFRFGDALQNVVVSALEQVITKLLIVKAINPFLGLIGLKDGGRVPGYAAGGRVMRAAAGMVVPNVGQAGVDSVPILAMPGEGVIKRDTMQQLEAFLNSHAAMASVTPDSIGGSGQAAATVINYNIARPVSFRDHLDLGENAVRAQREAARRVL